MADAITRVRELQAAAALAADPAAAAGTGASFQAALALRAHHMLDPGAADPSALPASLSLPARSTLSGWSAPPPGSGAGAAALAAAESQVGAAEQPPGSNDGPQIAGYRAAVAGAAAGEPWCAYFASWAAAQAGAPLGDAGGGFGSVAQITDWAARTGRLLPPDAAPAPGDLVLYGDRHVGLVESVDPDGTLHTVEGNYANAVSRVVRARAEATGFVRL